MNFLERIIGRLVGGHHDGDHRKRAGHHDARRGGYDDNNHGGSYDYRRSPPDYSSNASVKVCARCGNHSLINARFCQQCGAPLTSA